MTTRTLAILSTTGACMVFDFDATIVAAQLMWAPAAAGTAFLTLGGGAPSNKPLVAGNGSYYSDQIILAADTNLGLGLSEMNGLKISVKRGDGWTVTVTGGITVAALLSVEVK